jgi:hypothetical protein
VTYTPPDPSTYSIPSARRRATIAVLYLIPGILLFVVLPYVGLTQLAKYGLSSGYSLGFLVIAGLSLAVLGSLRYYARPGRAYGPLSIAVSAGAVLYLLYLARSSTISFGIGDSGTFSLSYGGMLLLFAIVPGIRIGSGVLTTIEDLTRPGERLPFDFPPR